MQFRLAIMNKLLVSLLMLSVIFVQTEGKKEEKPPAKDEYIPGIPFNGGGYSPKVCPLCDSSVFSYCNDKLFHDMCCCGDPYYSPFQCRFADCSYLHANTCQEHFLISECCCKSALYPYNRLK